MAHDVYKCKEMSYIALQSRQEVFAQVQALPAP